MDTRSSRSRSSRGLGTSGLAFRVTDVFGRPRRGVWLSTLPTSCFPLVLSAQPDDRERVAWFDTADGPTWEPCIGGVVDDHAVTGFYNLFHAPMIAVCHQVRQELVSANRGTTTLWHTLFHVA